MNVENCAAVVTGGAGGLGSAVVRRLVDAKARVVIADVADDLANGLVAELGDEAVRYVRTDVTDEAAVQHTIEAAQALGTLRVAVIAHGGSGGGPGRIVARDGTPQPLEGFRRTTELFLTGTFNVLRLAAAAMSQNEPDPGDGRGVVVTTSSIAAYEAQVGQAAYATAKGGVVSLTLAAARDLAPAGIRVMCIAPGTFFTPVYRMTEEEAQEKFGGTVPFPARLGRPDEYAQLAQQVWENPYLNGEVIRLDGALRFGLR